MKKIKIKHEKTFLAFLIILLIFVVFCYANVVYSFYSREEFVKSSLRIANQNQDSVFRISKILLYSSADAIDKSDNKSLQNLDMFKDSIESATPKYVTVNSEDERLPYQQMEFGRAKSAIFFPLYIDNVYIGYWIMESGTPHDFDNVDTTVLEVIKENIVSVLKTVVHQKTLETIVRKDLFTGLYSEEYLYGEGKKVIDQYTISTICMFKIINIQEINKKYCRELGNKVITEISRAVQEDLSSEYVFVRYMGPKFVIAFSGVESDSVVDFLNEIKDKIETMKIQLTEQEIEELNLNTNLKEKKTQQNAEFATPKINIAISSYYKGTALEEVLKRLEEYLDNAPANESDITNI